VPDLSQETLLSPDVRSDRIRRHPGEGPEVRRGIRTTAPKTTTGWPADLLLQATTRLQALALLYAFTFFMADFFPRLIQRHAREMLFQDPMSWASGGTSIAVALLVAAILRTGRLGSRALTAGALVFEVVSSYGIATAEFWQPLTFQPTWIGLSWVAVWVMIFNVVVPMVPRYAIMAALASVTAVPVMVRVSLSVFPPAAVPTPFSFFFVFVFPYLLVVVMAYVGARIVYTLGKEVSRARELGSYQLVERLGAGGMGEVWKANHRLLARPAAIKLIRPAPADAGIGSSSGDMHRRFEREAQIIAGLRSPHTVTLFDFGVSDDGVFYYVMELLEGLDAQTLVKQFGPLPPERVVHVLRQICHSLSEADSCGLVHRDIKPANIFLCRYGEDHDFVKVLDFGIAKAAHQSGLMSSTETAVTVANVIQGTPAFIAPEQALGGTELDGRTDIYATACVAYWLLTGELVFTAETPMALLLAHVHTQPEPPSKKTEMPIPPEIDALILSCLAKDREQRPRSARHLLKALDGLTLSNPWSEDRAREWWHTHLPSR
jgi:serine/threonine-protein kinase